MPLFDFVCRACGAEFELLVRGSEKPACPACGSTELAKQMSTFSARTGGGKSGGGAGSRCAGCKGRSCSTCR
ncbi:MAG: zinc ribbon domain-containing protein [Thermodesulfobacteriota bacterium]